MRLMKASGFALAAFVGMLAISTQAATVSPPDPQDLTIGDWSLLPEKSKFCYPAPKASLNHIFNAGFGMIVTEWLGMRENGNTFLVRYAMRNDGDKYPADIATQGSRGSVGGKLIDARHSIVDNYDKTGKLTSTYHREISEDGQTMIQTTTFTNNTCVVSAVFERR